LLFQRLVLEILWFMSASFGNDSTDLTKKNCVKGMI
jgi:hypothetical protein